MTKGNSLWHSVRPGERWYTTIPVTEDLNGAPIQLPLHVVRGKKDGPTLALLSLLHGCEWISVEIPRRVLERVNPDELAGTIVAVPVCNPPALQTLTRNTMDASDSADLNRAFGRPGTWITEQLAEAISENVMAHADALVDFHPLSWGTSFGAVIYAAPDNEAGRASRRMAAAFGYTSLMELPEPMPGTASGHAVIEHGIPAITPEVGGAGFGEEQDNAWLDFNVDGAFSIMRELGMVDGAATRLSSYSRWRKRARINPQAAGILLPEKGADLLADVKKGQLLGTVMSPYTMQVVEELRAPWDGTLYYASRSYPVRPGDWAFGIVGDAELLSGDEV